MHIAALEEQVIRLEAAFDRERAGRRKAEDAFVRTDAMLIEARDERDAEKAESRAARDALKESEADLDVTLDLLVDTEADMDAAHDLVERIRGALGTEEDDDALVDVARAAHEAEQAHAKGDYWARGYWARGYWAHALDIEQAMSQRLRGNLDAIREALDTETSGDALVDVAKEARADQKDLRHLRKCQWLADGYGSAWHDWQ